MKKIIFRILLVIVVLIAGFIIFILTSWDKQYADTPMPDIKASTDSAVIARGKYLAYGPAHCGQCHVSADKFEIVDQGAELPLSGGFKFTLPLGTIYSPNLTPDMETGIGKYTDGELARAMRHMVKRDNRTLFPFMPFQEVSDQDLTAIISFLRSQEPVKNEIKPVSYTFLGKMIYALGLIKPEGPKDTPAKSVVIDSTAAYGSYLANSVANCRGCHTERDLKTGKFTGQPFAGGLALPSDSISMGYSFVTPNLTPDPETGIMASWDEQTFINRMHAGRVHKGSHMPWGMFSRINDLELKAIYRYLRTLSPVKNKIAKTVYAPGEVVPGK